MSISLASIKNGGVVLATYMPNEKQAKAHASRARKTLYGGAIRGGKTRWLAEDGFKFLMKYPGIEAFFGRFDLADLMAPTQLYEAFLKGPAPELMKPWQQGGIILQWWRSWPPWIRFTNGSRAIFDGLKGWHKSAEYGWIGIDQAEEVPWETLELLDTRLMQRLPDGSRPPYRMRLTCNPAPGELKERFITSRNEDYAFIQALPSDNAENLPPDYIEQQRGNLSKEHFARYMQGSWDVFIGQAFPEFNRLIHVVPYFTRWQEEGWPVWRGVDHGITAPTVCLWLTKDPHEGDMYFVLEYEATERTAGENAQAIRQMSQGLSVNASWIDPRTATRGGDSKDIEWSVFKEYNQQGIYCALSQGTRQNRFAAWKQAIALDDKRRHPISHLYPAPRLYITENCTGLITTLPELKYREGIQEQGDDIEKLKDHHYDAGGFVLTGILNQQTQEAQEKGLIFMHPSGKNRR